MTQEHIFVTGASGLIGAEVCRLAVALGHQVSGLSRGGTPPAPNEPWHHGVRWLTGDVFDASGDWLATLSAADYLIHCVEPQPPQDPNQEERRAISLTRLRAVRHIASLAAQQHRLKKLVLISRDPALPWRYREVVSTTRAAEDELLTTLHPPTVVLRAGLVWGASRSIAQTAARELADHHGARRDPTLPLHRVERVAMTALRAALEPGRLGLLDAAQIELIGDALMLQ